MQFLHIWRVFFNPTSRVFREDLALWGVFTFNRWRSPGHDDVAIMKRVIHKTVVSTLLALCMTASVPAAAFAKEGNSIATFFPLTTLFAKEEKKAEELAASTFIPVIGDDKTASDEGVIVPTPMAQVQIDDVLPLVKKEVEVLFSADRVLPIDRDQMIGISTFFSRFHRGIDIRSHIGTPVVSIHSGKVIEVAYERGGYGRYVVIEHDNEDGSVRSLYAHLKETAVELGERVGKNTKIGSIGMTGRSTGPHLHLEIYSAEHAIDPLRYISKGIENTLALKK